MKKSLKKELFLLFLLVQATLIGFAQTGSASGNIVNQNNQALQGVSVVLQGTTLGALTDLKGNFKITGIKPGSYILTTRLIGYSSEQSKVRITEGNIEVNFQLKIEATSLDEVVVIGYGTEKKKDLTGAVATLSEKDFNKGPITSPAQLISGKMAGVQVISSGGSPGAANTIRIRGGASLNASNDPLIIIDGVPIDDKGISGISNPLSLINPNDIESFSILKDASATAIYGSRGSNGVIIISTKKGEIGGPLKVNFNSTESIANKSSIVDVLSADEYRTKFQQYLEKTENDPAARQYKLSLMGDANTNWQNEIYHPAFKTDNILSFSGGIKSLPYRFSIGYLNENGILKTSNFNRLSGSLNLSPKIFDDYLSVSIHLKGTLTQTRFANLGAIGSAVAFNPTRPVYTNHYDPNKPLSSTNTNLGGYFEWVDDNGIPLQLAGKNPVSMLEQENNSAEANESIGNIQLDYKFHFLPDLHANLNVGYDVSKSHGTDILPATLASVYTLKGTTSKYSQTKQNKLLDFYFNYVKDISSISSRIDATAGYSYQDFIRDEPAVQFTSGVGNDPARNPFKTQNTLVSYFGRLNYSFKDRYILTGTIRTDGSSRFAPDNRWGTFPSAALAWNIKQESFAKNLKAISLLKLRLGYGKTGQQDISSNDYPYLAGYNRSDDASSFPFGDTYYNMLRPSAYDQNIKWEETTTFNVGIDFGFANNRIGGSIDYFIKKTNNLISKVVTATGSNFSNILLTNVGDMENKGIEFNLNVIPVSSKNINWELNFNATHYNNKITNLTLSGVDDPTSPGTAAGATSFIGTSLQYHKVGYAPYTYYVQKQLYDAAGKPVEGSYADINGDGKVDEKDFYHDKSPNPTLLLGLSSRVTYKKVSLGFIMRANLGAYNYNWVAANTGYGDALSFANFLGNASSSMTKSDFSHIQQTSDYYIEKASFLRMDNIDLSYNIGKIGKVVNMSVSANVQNVFVVTNYSGLDPEVLNGIDQNFYPRPRIFSLGINIGF